MFLNTTCISPPLSDCPLVETTASTSELPARRKDRFFWRKEIPEEHHKSIEAFLKLFPHRYDYIYRALQPHDTYDTWLTAKDPHWQLADSSIMKAICLIQLDKIYGCRFDKWTRFAVLDIDANSTYHNLESIDKLRLVLRKAGLKCVLYQSSQSGGWHLYIPFGQRGRKLNCRDLHQALTDLLEYSGFKISKGNLEIFPNPGSSDKSKGFGLRLPLQFGFAFLNQLSLEIKWERYELSAIDAINYFMEDMRTYRNSPMSFRKLIRYVQHLKRSARQLPSIKSEPGNNNLLILNERGGKPYNNITADDNQQDTYYPMRQDNNITTAFEFGKAKLPKGINIDVWLKGQQYYQYGLNGKSQRSEALFCISHYLFYGDKSKGIKALGYGFEEQRAELMTKWLNLKNYGFSKEVSSAKISAFAQIDRLVYSKSKGKKPNLSTGYKLANERRAKLAQENITRWVAKLQQTGIKSQKAFAKLTGIDVKTLRKYRPLWADLLEVYNIALSGKMVRLAPMSSSLIQCA